MRCRACGEPADRAGSKDGAALFVCRRCGSLTRAADADPAARYEDYLPAATLALPPATRRRYREMLAGLSRFQSADSRRLLDVGCGAGLFLEVAREEGWSVEGVELSARAAEEAARKGIRVHVGEVGSIGLAPGFDAAVSLETVEHVPDPTAFLAAIGTLLRPGGGLLLSTPNYDSLNRRLLGREWLPVSPDHLCLLTPGGLRTCLARAGFRVERVTTRTFLYGEALKRFRRSPARSQGFDARGTAALQRDFAERPALRRLKDVANAVLARTGTGDVLLALATREEAP